MHLTVSAATDVGLVREGNEDSFLVDHDLGLFIVADGMGGHRAGEKASSMSVEVVRESLLEHRTALDEQASTEGEPRGLAGCGSPARGDETRQQERLPSQLGPP